MKYYDESEVFVMEVYLDNAATTVAFDEVTELMCKVLKEDYGNPSSLHRKGQKRFILRPVEPNPIILL